MSHTELIQVRNLSKAYFDGGERHPVLNSVNFSIRAGECVAIRGRSGSGKSTLLNLLAGIDRPDAGSISIQGQDLHRMPERQRTLYRRRNIGFVYQFFNLIPTLSVAENVRLPMELNQWTDARMRERLAFLLQGLGLSDRTDAFPDRLSGGEQQRVAIARALAQEPLLVLADEPTGNLDATTGRHMLELLLKLADSTGHTLVVVTHSLEVARSADRLLVLEDGGLQEGGAQLAW